MIASLHLIELELLNQEYGVQGIAPSMSLVVVELSGVEVPILSGDDGS